MKTSGARLIAFVVVAALALGATPISAQDPDPQPPPPPPAPTDPAPPPEPVVPPATAAATETPQEKEKAKFRFGLYAAVGWGNFGGKEIQNDLETATSFTATNRTTFNDLDRGHAALGWRLPEGKGDFRLIFNGYRETSYSFQTRGLESSVTVGNDPSTCQSASGPCLVQRWVTSVEDGAMTIESFRATWDPSRDFNGNNVPDLEELVIPTEPEFSLSRPYAETLQNQLETVDLVYGREFGGRRFSSHWWTGMRHFQYKGNVLAGGWLLLSVAGQGFTEGAALPLLSFAQDASGFGPTGAWEVDFNFFERRLALFVRAQAALMFSSIESDSGDFHTLVRLTPQETFLPAPARLVEDRRKTTWQDSAALGARWTMRSGLELEVGYSINGYLDTLLTPVEITIPNILTQAPQGSSAIYKTRDLVFDGWHATVGFQF